MHALHEGRAPRVKGNGQMPPPASGRLRQVRYTRAAHTPALRHRASPHAQSAARCCAITPTDWPAQRRMAGVACRAAQAGDHKREPGAVRAPAIVLA